MFHKDNLDQDYYLDDKLQPSGNNVLNSQLDLLKEYYKETINKNVGIRR